MSLHVSAYTLLQKVLIYIKAQVKSRLESIIFDYVYLRENENAWFRTDTMATLSQAP